MGSLEAAANNIVALSHWDPKTKAKREEGEYMSPG
jgi:hypothetical protein